MKLTADTLRSLIKEVISESKQKSWILTENYGNNDFENAYSKMADPQGPAQFAFITAHNPPGKSKHGKGFGWNNENQQRRLINDLSTRGYEFVTGHGVYGGAPEESLMVFSKNNKIEGRFKVDMIKLGKKYLQDAIVYGEKYLGAAIDYSAGEKPIDADTGEPMSQAAGMQTETGPRIFWNMKMVMLEPDKTSRPTSFEKYHIDKQSNFLLTGKMIQDRKDFYTIMRGMKSYIPFYDDEREEYIANPYPVRQ